jgi:polysaccharide export outer membrane protein
MEQFTTVARTYGFIVTLGVLSCVLGSCAQQTLSQRPPISPESIAVPQDYRLGPEDVIEVMVWKNADLSKVVPILPDGKISLPLIGEVQAAGFTTAQLAEAITEKLKEYYKEPAQVTVFVQQVNSYAIYILGEVRNPGKHIVKTGTNFLQAITLAGGFTEFASTSKILLIRQGDVDNKEFSMRVRYKDVVSGVQDNIVLKPSDSIIIP